MKELVLVVIIFVAWLALQKYILPRVGVPT